MIKSAIQIKEERSYYESQQTIVDNYLDLDKDQVIQKIMDDLNTCVDHYIHFGTYINCYSRELFLLWKHDIVKYLDILFYVKNNLPDDFKMNFEPCSVNFKNVIKINLTSDILGL